MKTMIPCATIYRVKLPDADDMWEFLSTMPLKPVGDREADSHGFIDVPWGEGIVTTLEGGYAFTLASEERILPASAIKKELNDRCDKFEEQNGYRPGRKLAREMKEEVVFDLLPRALVREVVTTCFYDTREGLLYVPSTSDKRTSLIVRLLVHTISAIEFQTVVVDGRVHGLTDRFNSWINGDYEAFGDFTPYNHVLLSKGGSKLSVKRPMLDNAEAGLKEALDDGFSVQEIGLSDDDVSFVMTDRFRLKSIKQADVSRDYDPFQNAAVEMLYMRNIVGKLLEMIGPAASPVDYDEDL